MDWTLPSLPYPMDALEPHLGRETLEYHYGKHHAGYLTKLREEINGSPLGKCSLEEIVVRGDGKIFNLAAQVWNHTFYWRSLSPDGGGAPPAPLRTEIARAFGSFDGFRTKLIETAVNRFGSGWAWLYRDRRDGRLVVGATHDAETPLAVGHTPLVTIDVWEHAYYLDYKHERERYVEAVVDHLINWEFVGANLEGAAGSASHSR